MSPRRPLFLGNGRRDHALAEKIGQAAAGRIAQIEPRERGRVRHRARAIVEGVAIPAVGLGKAPAPLLGEVGLRMSEACRHGEGQDGERGEGAPH